MIVECPGCRSRYDVSGRPSGTRARCRCGQIFTLPEPPRRAALLSCPSCGAGVSPTNHRCEYCSAELLVKACPRCFARIFHGSRHCRHCGGRVDVPASATRDGEAMVRRCPRCPSSPELVARLIDDVLMDECPECFGVWLDTAAVEQIVEERRQATAEAVLAIPPRTAAPGAPGTGRMYVKCPDCDAVMNRVNFGRVSGIVVDVCRAHGTWFDADELRQVVEFVMKGGLERGERRRLEQMKEEARSARSSAILEGARVGRSDGGLGLGGDAGTVVMGGGVLGAIAQALLER